MDTQLDCIPCFLRQSLEAIRRVTEDARAQEGIMRDVLPMTADLDLGQSPPSVDQAIRRRLRDLTGVKDPYEVAKRHFNRLAMDALPELAALVNQAPDPLLAAVRFTIAANAIDMGVAGAIGDAEVRAALRGTHGEPLHGDLEGFRKALTAAKEILYLADNAGELAIDRLLIEAIGPKRVTLAVRGFPVLNDATLVDAREVGMQDLLAVIDNGSDAAGTILSDCSLSFRKRFQSADLIIVKGQGNFETLSDVAGNLFFLLKVKCPVLSGHVGLPLGAHALLHSPRTHALHLSGATPFMRS